MSREPTADRSSPPGAKRHRLTLFLVGWLILMLGVSGGMLYVRDRTLSSMGTPEALAEWEAWRQSDPNQRDDLSVKRRAPKSPEPPALVLMRDHFPVLFGGAIVFSSLLYIALAFMLAGMLRSSISRSTEATREN